jgi:hypothetical protein
VFTQLLTQRAERTNALARRRITRNDVHVVTDSEDINLAAGLQSDKITICLWQGHATARRYSKAHHNITPLDVLDR